MQTFASTTLAALLFLPSVTAWGWGCKNVNFDVSVCFEMGELPIVGATVKCWDDDYGWDDHVGPSNGVVTDSNGCATLNDRQCWWEKPDIYCEIEANGGCFRETLTSTKNDHNYRNDLNFGNIVVAKDNDYCTENGYGQGYNGCGASYFPSWLRDALTEASGFAAPCTAHDSCYEDCTKSQQECDDEFYYDMLGTCAGQSNCEFLAYQYFLAVELFGEASYNESRGAC